MSESTIYLLLAALAAYLVMQRLRGGKRASPEAVRGKIEGGARVLDVRSPGEFSSGAFPKAKNIPVDQLESRLSELGAKEKPVVVYCASGARSSRAARILAKAGFSDVVDAGGLASMPR